MQKNKQINIKLNRKSLKVPLIVLGVIFLFGGGPDFIVTLLSHNAQDPVILNPYAKLTALAPASMFCYIIGFVGLMLLYWGGKDFRKDEELAKKRLVAAIILIGASLFVLELLLRFGYNAI